MTSPLIFNYSDTPNSLASFADSIIQNSDVICGVSWDYKESTLTVEYGRVLPQCRKDIYQMDVFKGNLRRVAIREAMKRVGWAGNIPRSYKA